MSTRGMGRGGVVRSAIAASIAGACAWAAVGAIGPTAVGAQLDILLDLRVGPGPTVVAGDSCIHPEPGFEGASVQVDVTSSFRGSGRTSEPRTIGSGRVTPGASGTWEYTVPAPGLVPVPAWAEEIVVQAQARCFQAIGDGFTYLPASAVRTIDRSTSLEPPATTAPASAPEPAPPAAPVSGVPSLTG